MISCATSEFACSFVQYKEQAGVFFRRLKATPAPTDAQIEGGLQALGLAFLHVQGTEDEKHQAEIVLTLAHRYASEAREWPLFLSPNIGESTDRGIREFPAAGAAGEVEAGQHARVGDGARMTGFVTCGAAAVEAFMRWWCEELVRELLWGCWLLMLNREGAALDCAFHRFCHLVNAAPCWPCRIDYAHPGRECVSASGARFAGLCITSGRAAEDAAMWDDDFDGR